MITFDAPASAPANPPVDAYSLRLVTARRLYDRGTLVSHAPSLAGLASPGVLSANPIDLARLGVMAGDRVKVTSAKGSITTAVAPDASVPTGTAVMAWNESGAAVTALIDAGAQITEVRLETTS